MPALRRHERLFDRLAERWESPRARRAMAWFTVAAFLFSLASIELSRLGILPSILGHPLPTNHLAAISWAFTLLLFFEVLDLVFGLARSVANALGKQLEIFSLILIRKAFDELAKLPEPIHLESLEPAVLRMGALAAGALAVFGLLVPYYRLQAHRPISEDPADVARFVTFKKAVCLGLLAAYGVTAAVYGLGTLTVAAPDDPLSLDFFEVFYTVLVFADVLLVIASMMVSREYRVVFRNFSFAAVTIFLRLALASQPYQKALMGIATALFAVGAAWIYERAREVRAPGEPDGSDERTD
jgi:hypothetical protein